MILNPGLRPDPPLADLFGRETVLSGPLNGLAWTVDRLAVATGDGTVRFMEAALARSYEIAAHEGAILAFALTMDRSGVLTGGDDGRVVLTRPGAGIETVHDAKGKWIDHVAAGPERRLAWSQGKTVMLREGDAPARSLEHPSTAGGLAFDRAGQHLAVAHYGGATLWAIRQTEPKRRTLGWKGSHVGCAFNPTGKFLITVMQENALHGWRLSDQGNLRMAGYPSKPKSLSFSANGSWLATSGAEGAVLWPFKGKDGPMGKGGEVLCPRPSISTAVAWHPRSEVLAVGFSDGGVLLARRADQGVILVRRPKTGAIEAIAWSADGAHLAYGTEGGLVGTVNLSAAIK